MVSREKRKLNSSEEVESASAPNKSLATTLGPSLPVKLQKRPLLLPIEPVDSFPPPCGCQRIGQRLPFLPLEMSCDLGRFGRM